MAFKSIDTPIWQLSVRELIEIIDNNSTLMKKPKEEKKPDVQPFSEERIHGERTRNSLQGIYTEALYPPI